MKNIDKLIKEMFGIKEDAPDLTPMDKGECKKVAVEFAKLQSDYDKDFYGAMIERKIRAATWKAFCQFAPYIESEDVIGELNRMHEEFVKTLGFGFSSTQK